MVTEAIGLAMELKEMSMIGQLFNEGCSHALITKDLGQAGASQDDGNGTPPAHGGSNRTLREAAHPPE